MVNPELEKKKKQIFSVCPHMDSFGTEIILHPLKAVES